MTDLHGFLASCNDLTAGKALRDIFLSVIVLLGEYHNWCQGAYALTSDCRRVKNNSAEAVAWSIEGAIGKLSNPAGIVPPYIIQWLDTLALELTACDQGVGWFNDTFDHGTIIDFLEEAYRRLP